jgi:hypothetical protein
MPRRASIAIKPSAIFDQFVFHQHGQAGCPGHLLNLPVFIEPYGCRDQFWFPFLIEQRSTIRPNQLDRRDL